MDDWKISYQQKIKWTKFIHKNNFISPILSSIAGTYKTVAKIFFHHDSRHTLTLPKKFSYSVSASK